MDDHDLMGLRVDTSFIHDERGRMLRSNSPDQFPAPRLLLGWTASGYVARFGAQTPDALVHRLTEIIARQSAPGDPRELPAGLAAIREELERHDPITREGGGPAYRFPAEITGAGDAVQVTDTNVEVARDTFPWLLTELHDWWPCFAVVRDGAVVSVCFSARIGARAAEAGVETLPDFRGHGYATTVTAAWGGAIRSSGRIPLYSTSWDNLASQGVARRVGLTLFGADVTLD